MPALNPSDMVADHFNLVSLPEIALRINQLIDNPNSTAEHIAELISKDAALTIRLLKIVNSSFYNFQSQVDTVSKAISIIGTRELRDLVMATTIINKFDKIPDGLASPESFWRHNIACATAARIIASELKIKNSERFYIAGLLHDIGKLLMYIAAPELSLQILSLMAIQDSDMKRLEEIAFGFTHDVLGAELIRKWGLPPMISTVVRYHHTPSVTTDFQIETAVIYLANSIANSIEMPFSIDDDIQINENILLSLNCNDENIEHITAISKEIYLDTINLIYIKKAA